MTASRPTPAPGFAGLGLSAALVQAAAAAGWTEPTPIQRETIPSLLQGRDVLALAPTGAGKTGAYLLPLLQRLLAWPGLEAERPRRLHVLILAPTRELAAQIGATVRLLAPRLKTLVAAGGVSINPQMLALRGGVHLLVATPGRLLDLVEQRALQVGDLSLLLLDEADRLLDLGFADELGRILALLPDDRQTLMFSATMPQDVAQLAARVLHDPVRLEAPAATAQDQPDIAQRAIEVDTARRTALLRHLIAQEGWTSVLVFVATQYASEHVAAKLVRAGLEAAALHGRLSQGRRHEVLADFHAGRLAVLVATDLAARGIDFSNLAAVVNFDLPRSSVDHVHRIGRTGRAGMAGVALSFILADAPGSEPHFRLLEKRQAQPVARERIAGFEPAATSVPLPVADGQGGVKGRRKSKKDKLREAAAGQHAKSTV